MTEHLKVFGYLAIVAVSTPVLVYLWQTRRRHPRPGLGWLFVIALLNTIYLWIEFAFIYLRINQLEAIYHFTWFGGELLFADLMRFLDLALLATCGALWYAFRGRRPPGWIWTGLAGWCALLPAGHAIKTLWPAQPGLVRMVESVQHTIFDYSYYLIIPLLLLIILAIRNNHRENDSGQLKSLAVLYLIAVAAFGLLNLLTARAITAGGSGGFRPYFMAAHGLLFLYSLLFPWIWIRWFFLPRENRAPDGCSPAEGPAAGVPVIPALPREVLLKTLDSLGLSGREAEIAILIMEGKSNKEIASVLDLSPSTVKNHLYKTYQKLKINSRFELIHLVSRRQ